MTLVRVCHFLRGWKEKKSVVAPKQKLIWTTASAATSCLKQNENVKYIQTFNITTIFLMKIFRFDTGLYVFHIFSPLSHKISLISNKCFTYSKYVWIMYVFISNFICLYCGRFCTKCLDESEDQYIQAIMLLLSYWIDNINMEPN